MILLRCYRSGVRKADADIYRRLERAERHLHDPHWTLSQIEKEHAFRSAFAEIKSNLRDAIQEGKRLLKYKISPEDITTLENIEQKLTIHFFDKPELETMMETIENIFAKYGLEPRIF